jgi:hypothetical protein
MTNFGGRGNRCNEVLSTNKFGIEALCNRPLFGTSRKCKFHVKRAKEIKALREKEKRERPYYLKTDTPFTGDW